MGARVLGGEDSQRMKLATHFHLVPRLRMSGALRSTPSIRLHGVDYSLSF